MENQICTNKEQSSRLLAAGVRPETSDCYLHRIMETDDWSSENVQEQIIESWMNKPELLDMTSRYPAWSLSRLIWMMPRSYQDDIDGMIYCLSGNFVEFMYSTDFILTKKEIGLIPVLILSTRKICLIMWLTLLSGSSVWTI